MANASVDLLSAACAHLTGRTENRTAATKLDRWKPEDWRAALLDVPLDERAYADRLTVDRSVEMEALWAWWSDPEADDRVSPVTTGYLGVFLLTLVSMHRSDRIRYLGEAYESGEIAGESPVALCRKLIADPQVQQAMKGLYAPSESDGPVAAVWNTIDFTSMEFHRHGTTSIIISVYAKPPAVGRAERHALKCLIYPHLRTPAMVKATKDYQRDFGGVRPKESPLVTVWASHDSWVFMDFVDGPTLTDHLRSIAGKRKEPKSEILRAIDVEQLRVLGTALLDAMAVLAEKVGHHDDLTPSNIIVQAENDTTVKLKLIDLGVNFLHTRILPGAEPGEAGYVAPEVKANGIGGPRADLYSLGMVLIAIGGIPRTTDGTVPDQFYVASVGLARLLEDLLDADPGRRLIVSGIGPGPAGFKEIRDLFVREIEVLEAAEYGKPKTLRQRVKGIVPGATEVARQRAIAKVRKRQAKTTDKATRPMQAHHLRQAKALKRWAIACAFLAWVTIALVLTWWSRDLDLFWQAKYVEYANFFLNRSGDGIPFLDDIRAADYPIPDAWDNLPVRIVALTYALTGVRLYLNIFADMTPHSALRRRGWKGVRTAAASFMMRATAIYPFIYILVPTLVQRRWWVIFSPLGIITVAVMISACLWFARDANARAREAGLSTVPKGEIMTLQRMESWAPVAWLYAVPVVIIGTFLYNDRLQDELMYAIAIGLINMGIQYVKNTGSDAPYVRAGLTRAILAAERLDVLEGKSAKEAPKPRVEAPVKEPVA
ncbi:protein kinase domain-containing protein [Glycomyces rhizosphaerae]|uniref:non-specific serine/threonine protein kinase n=1 Tax=Glycomyces rhizosphaerae TaxID=2054422 RepID=A0ABV7Q1J6_9ACTN